MDFSICDHKVCFPITNKANINCQINYYKLCAAIATHMFVRTSVAASLIVCFVVLPHIVGTIRIHCILMFK